MNLSKKTSFSISVIMTSLIGVLYAASSTILLDSLKHAEEQYTHRVVKGVLSAFTQTQDDISSGDVSWSSWDDTGKFVQDANEDYIKENFSSESLAMENIDLALFIQPSGRIVYGTGFDRVHQKKTPIPEGLRPHLSPQSRLLQHPTINSSTKGIVLLPEGPVFLNSLPILNNEGEGPIQGTMIFGRFLDTDEVARLNKIARVPITIHAVNETKLPVDFQTVRNELSQNNSILVRLLSDQTIAGYALLPDIYGKPALLLRLDVRREIYRQGQKSLLYLVGALVIVGTICCGAMLLLLKRLVLAEHKWQQSEEYRRLVAQASESILLVDTETKIILETNSAFENLLGFTSTECRSLTLYDVIVDDCESINRHLLEILNNQHLTVEQQYRRQDGILVNVEVNASLTSHNGRDVFCIIVHDITKRKQVEEQLLYNAFHDSLTGLANRALFMERLKQAIQQGKCCDDYSAVLFLDLDRFKVINDSLGHMVGDQLLVALAQRLRACLRPYDTFARLGGDEFAVILENCSDASEVVERIQQKLKLPFDLNGQEVFATASIGVILTTIGYDQPEDLLRDADTAMYRAKAQGKARYEVFNVAMHDSAVAQLELETDLRRAVANREFQLYYQPVMSLSSNRIVGFEALVRWQHPKRGFISPEEFIPIAEETGLIIPLGWWVLREACQQMHIWQVQFSANPLLTISVNFSAKQFTQTDIVEQIAQTLHETNLNAQNLRLELTESVILECPESVTVVLQQIKALGISLALDDFGTGYSSLSYLHRLPINNLKIDRSFISRINHCSDSWEIVRAIAMLAQALNIGVVAEGIETREQLAQLKLLQCEYGQGYFFSKPLNSKAASELLAQKKCLTTGTL